MSNVLLILFPTQLFRIEYIDKIFNYSDIKIKKKYIILWEHEYFFSKYKYHKIKLVFHRSSMKNYYDNLPVKLEKKYIELKESNKIDKFIKDNSINQIIFFNPIEKELLKIIESNQIFKSKIEMLIYPTPYFLNSTDYNTNNLINNELNAIRHDLFYKKQRINYNIMVKKVSNDKFEPIGNKWSFDTENRSPFAKEQNEPEILELQSKKHKDYIIEAIEYITTNFSDHYGTCNIKDFIYPINREEGIKWLNYFVKNKLDNFGKYEDAFSSKIKFGYHSVSSMLTNVGLITPNDILKCIENYKTNIASKEGFIRQVIGWREYCYFSYDLYNDKLKSSSVYTKNKNKIPEKVWKCNTLMPPIDNILNNVTSNGYSHHIERLMGIGNFLILIGVNSDEIYKWFQTMYIDAYDVFMVPNIYGMLCYGKLNEKNHLMTRPYFCSSNYLIKMSNFKSSEIEVFDKKYKWDEIFDSLYYSHINNYSHIFEKIYSSASAVKRWNSFNSSKKKHILELSNLYIKWIYK